MGSTHCSVQELIPGKLEEETAAAAIRISDALLVASGGGMGADCGLGTSTLQHVGRAGVWPPLKAMHLDFSQMSTPEWFEGDPRLAWAFWGFRYKAYTSVEPHDGYRILAKWGSAKKYGLFSVTSNIDGHWERTPGVREDQCWECHGTLLYMHAEGYGNRSGLHRMSSEMIEQLRVPEWDLEPGETVEVLRAGSPEPNGELLGAYALAEQDQWVPGLVGSDGCVIVDEDGKTFPVKGVRRPGGEDLMRVVEDCELPKTPDGASARPAVLMFGDLGVNPSRIHAQELKYKAWKKSLPGEIKLAIIEIGAGVATRTIRNLTEDLTEAFPNATFVRVNLEHSGVPPTLVPRSCSLERGALEAMRSLDALVKKLEAEA